MTTLRLKKILFKAIIFGALVCNVSYGNELPFLKDVEIRSRVSLNKGTNIFTYDYTIKNSIVSVGNLVGVDIDIRKPKGGIDLSKEGLIYGKGYLKHSLEDILSLSETPPLDMVGIQSPYDWISGFSVHGTAWWGGGDYIQIKPGESLNGFELNSYGLPGIREFKAEPSFDVNKYYPSVDTLASDEEEAELLAKIKEDEEKISFKGKTIGPTAPPADFKPVDFLNSIINMKHGAYKLGWIKNEGILKSLDAKLENAKKDIEKGNTRSAKNTLKAFINEVEAQGCESYENCTSGKHLTSEAYGLLKYNAQYLVDRL